MGIPSLEDHLGLIETAGTKHWLQMGLGVHLKGLRAILQLRPSDIPGLVNIQKAIEHGYRHSEFSQP